MATDESNTTESLKDAATTMLDEARSTTYGLTHLCELVLHADGFNLDPDSLFPMIQKQVVEITETLDNLEPVITRLAEAGGGA